MVVNVHACNVGLLYMYMHMHMYNCITVAVEKYCHSHALQIHTHSHTLFLGVPTVFGCEVCELDHGRLWCRG